MISLRVAKLRAGMLVLTSMLPGVVPFNLIYDMFAVSAGMSAWLVVATSIIVLGSALQMTPMQLWIGGAPAPVIVATVSVVNLRYTLYSASIALVLAHLPYRWK